MDDLLQVLKWIKNPYEIIVCSIFAGESASLFPSLYRQKHLW